MGSIQGLYRPVAAVDLRRCPEMADLIAAWRREPASALCDVVNGPLEQFAPSLVVAERESDGHFRYLHYGDQVCEASGLDMRGRVTREFAPEIGAFFAECYRACLQAREPLYSVNRAKMTHVTHSWHRLMLPILSDDGPPARIVAMVRMVATVSEVLTDFTRDRGFFGGTLEPIADGDMVSDFAILSLTDPVNLFGLKPAARLSDLYGRPLSLAEVDRILNAHDGMTVVNRALPESMERFGRMLVIKISGNAMQPVFSIADETEIMEARAAAEERREAMEDFAQVASDWMWETNADHIFTMVSSAIEEAAGVPHASLVGTSRLLLPSAPQNAEAYEAHKRDLQARRPFRDFTYQLFRDDGRCVWIRSNGKPRFDARGVFIGYRGTGRDVTVEVEARQEADRRTEELAEAQRIGRLGSWAHTFGTDTLYISPELHAILDLPWQGSDVPFEQMKALMPDGCRNNLYVCLEEVRGTGSAASVDIQFRCSSGKMVDLLLTARPVHGAFGDVVGVQGTAQDISARKAAERELETLAYFDPMTGLGNRSYFTRELEAVLGPQDGDGTDLFGLFVLDLDRFKEVNDSLGHAAGDELLRRVGERLVSAAGGGSTVCRLGGDEFAVIVRGVVNAADLALVANAIISTLTAPITLAQGLVQIECSIGMVLIPSQTRLADEAMRFADLALYEVKSRGRGRAMLFHEELDAGVHDRRNLARDLGEALRSDGLDAHYQLQVDVLQGKAVGFESLVRWNHPERGMVPPSQFIPIAESSRLIADLGQWMVRHVCRQGTAWLEAGGAPVELSVNLSLAQLWHRDVESDIRATLEETGFPPHLLCVELTESVFERETLSRMKRLFDGLKAMGVKFALDDFGTGYSSLSYLGDMPFDKLKIDKSFVRNCDRDTEAVRLLQGIVGLGKGLDMELVVEGVETEDELLTVCSLGCDLVQGFLFSKPKPFHEACLDAAALEARLGLEPTLWKDGAAQPDGSDRRLLFFERMRQRLGLPASDAKGRAASADAKTQASI